MVTGLKYIKNNCWKTHQLCNIDVYFISFLCVVFLWSSAWLDQPKENSKLRNHSTKEELLNNKAKGSKESHSSDSNPTEMLRKNKLFWENPSNILKRILPWYVTLHNYSNQWLKQVSCKYNGLVSFSFIGIMLYLCKIWCFCWYLYRNTFSLVRVFQLFPAAWSLFVLLRYDCVASPYWLSKTADCWIHSSHCFW